MITGNEPKSELTILQHFTAVAMHGLLLQHDKLSKHMLEDLTVEYTESPTYQFTPYSMGDEDFCDYNSLAQDAVKIASEMINELNTRIKV